MKQNLIKTIIENKRKGLFLSHFFHWARRDQHDTTAAILNVLHDAQ
jgi:hypothetical protein